MEDPVKLQELAISLSGYLPTSPFALGLDFELPVQLVTGVCPCMPHPWRMVDSNPVDHLHARKFSLPFLPFPVPKHVSMHFTFAFFLFFPSFSCDFH